MSKYYECIFLDRDGTINFDPGYISCIEQFKFFDYTFKAMKLLSNLTSNFIIITNQSGVSRGLIKEDELIKINSFIHKKFSKYGLNLLRIYHCIDLPGNASEFRKPALGMFLQASQEHSINLSNCIMIGDSHKDIIPAFKLGMESMLVLSGNGLLDQKKFDNTCKPDYIVKNLLAGAQQLIR
tara:strand:+ start:2100 stop:2645 length:546 start_codon:yes stop_codon:yes gene_type:complete